MTPTEWRLLVALIESAGRPVHSERLFARVLAGDEAASQALQAHVSRLRKKLGPEARRVETVWGIGYRFVVEASA